MLNKVISWTVVIGIILLLVAILVRVNDLYSMSCIRNPQSNAITPSDTREIDRDTAIRIE